MRELGLTDLTNFIADEMVIVHDLLFSREAVGQYEEKPVKQRNKTDNKTDFQTQVIKETRDRGRRDKARCSVCNDNHDIEKCEIFLKQTMEDRGKTLYRKRLCFKYLGNISKEHNPKDFVNRKRCRACSGR